MNETVDPFLEWDAAYVLGSLSADDRRLFEHHLANCPACTSAVAELAGIPGILTKIDVDAAVAIASAPDQSSDSPYEPDHIQNLAKAARLRQRRFRTRVTMGITAAAAVLIAVGILTGKAIQPTTDLASQGTVVAMSKVQSSSMTANLRVTSKPWGTRFDWSCNYGTTWTSDSKPVSYDLVITDASGAKTTVATWSAAGSSAIGLSASSGIPISDIRTVEIRVSGFVAPLVRGQL